MQTKTLKEPVDNLEITSSSKYSIEFFHIYSDEKIKAEHQKSIDYLKEVQEVWEIDSDLILLLDDYNPTKHITSIEDINNYLNQKGIYPAYWAHESDFVDTATAFLEQITNKKLQKNYKNYIQKHNKMPCSLLTATWYLCRLGELDVSVIKSFSEDDTYNKAERLINILPSEYKEVEARALKLIKHSPFAHKADLIQDLFYDASPHTKLDLF